MTAAERQARRRARLRLASEQAARPARSRPACPLPRPQRWMRAVNELVALQEEYRDWLDNLPESLHETALGEKLQEITELDLSELEAVEPPKGYGRD